MNRAGTQDQCAQQRPSQACSGRFLPAVTYVDVPLEPWRKALEDSNALPPHVLAHLTVMARLIQQGRYDRLTAGVEQITGSPPLDIRDFVGRHTGAYPPAK